jgi:hypothetical protein
MTSIKTLLFVIILILETGACSGPHGQESSDSPVGLKGREAAHEETSEVQRLPSKAGEVLVRFKSHVTSERVGQIIGNLDLEIIRAFSVPNLYLLKIPDTSTVPDAMEHLRQYEDVKYAEPNYLRTNQRRK